MSTLSVGFTEADRMPISGCAAIILGLSVGGMESLRGLRGPWFISDKAVEFTVFSKVEFAAMAMAVPIAMVSLSDLDCSWMIVLVNWAFFFVFVANCWSRVVAADLTFERSSFWGT